MLSVPVAVVAGGHPLRALATADGAVPRLGPAWAEVGRAADPVGARMNAVQAVGTEWQWTALPADYAGVVAASGMVQQSTRLVAQGGAYVESLQGRCAKAGSYPPQAQHRPPARLPLLPAARRYLQACAAVRPSCVGSHVPPAAIAVGRRGGS